MTLQAIRDERVGAGTLPKVARRMPVIAGAIVTMCALAGCTPHPRPVPVVASAPTTSEWSYRQFRGTQIRTEHWVIYTTTMEPSWMDRLPRFVEACYSQYKALVPAPDTSRSLALYLFANGVQWDDFAAMQGVPRTSIDVQSRLGGFSHKGVSAVYLDSPANTLRAIAHTGMHQYLWRHSPAQPPTWVDEALATLAEGFDWRGRTFRFEPRFNDWRFEEARAAIQRDWLLDLHTILTLDGLAKLPNPQTAAKTYLAQLWTIAVFLQNDRHYRKGFEQLRQDVSTDTFQRKMEGYMAAGKEAITPGEAAFEFYITQDQPLFWTRYYDKTVQYLNLVR
jgi:hypothetical protein